jgi:multimeric flavodoxin WrbA
VGQQIRKYEKDMGEVIRTMKVSDLIILSYPVYTFLAPSQLHRFIELLKASGEDFSGKYVSQITTSKHFYDVTAHRYIEDNCHDLGMHVIHGLSADMEDLLSVQGQKDAEAFFRYAVFCVENDVYEPTPKMNQKTQIYIPGLAETKKSNPYDTVIVADLREGDETLKNMIDDFVRRYPYTTRLVNIAEYPFQGGCIGCFNCAGSGECIYKDGFASFLRDKIQTADAIIYAFTIRDHSMGAKFKTYDDRQFCNGHRTVTEGKPFGYIVNGDYEVESNLRMVIEARCEVGHNFLAGVGYTRETMEMLCTRMEYALQYKYIQPRNFYGVGGMKIFRDLIWMMRGLMKADHEFYKAHGIYDFPQKHRGKMMLMCVLGAMVRNPRIKAKMGNKMNEGMVAPYLKVIQRAGEN